jgi:hypothetical protein
LEQKETSVRERLKGEAASYAHGEDRPLGSYLVLMAIYTSVVVGVGSAARVAGKSLPARPPVRDVAMVAVATHKIARLISKDPVTSPLRAPFTRFVGTSGDSELEEEVRGTMRRPEILAQASASLATPAADGSAASSAPFMAPTLDPTIRSGTTFRSTKA